jgi:hypothetical protein
MFQNIGTFTREECEQRAQEVCVAIGEEGPIGFGHVGLQPAEVAVWLQRISRLCVHLTDPEQTLCSSLASKSCVENENSDTLKANTRLLQTPAEALASLSGSGVIGTETALFVYRDIRGATLAYETHALTQPRHPSRFFDCE